MTTMMDNDVYHSEIYLEETKQFNNEEMFLFFFYFLSAL